MKTSALILASLLTVTAFAGVRRIEWVGAPDTRLDVVKAPTGSFADVSNSVTRLMPGGVVLVPPGVTNWAGPITVSNRATFRWASGSLTVSTGSLQWTGTNMLPCSGSAVVTSTNQMACTWSAASDSRVTSYVLRYGLAGASVASATVTGTNTTITNLSAGTYSAWLTARDVYGNESSPSATNLFTVSQ